MFFILFMDHYKNTQKDAKNTHTAKKLMLRKDTPYILLTSH